MIFIFEVIIDPYNYIFDSNFIDNETKTLSITRTESVIPRGVMFWNLIAFKKNPSNHVIIGDSRGASIDTALVKEYTGNEYFNFAVPGANYQTNISIFWHIAENTDLRSVYWQLGFPQYNLTEQSNNLFQAIYPYYDHFYKYLLKDWFWVDSYYAFYFHLFPRMKEKFYPCDDDRTLNRDKNWDEIIKRQGTWKLANYQYPEEIYRELRRISEYCKTNNIDLNFVIFPNHPALYSLIKDYDLEDERLHFKKDIYSIGKTYDFSYVNKFTLDSSLFFDLYHSKQFVTDTITHDIFTIDSPDEVISKYQ